MQRSSHVLSANRALRSRLSCVRSTFPTTSHSPSVPSSGLPYLPRPAGTARLTAAFRTAEIPSRSSTTASHSCRVKGDRVPGVQETMSSPRIHLRHGRGNPTISPVGHMHTRHPRPLTWSLNTSRASSPTSDPAPRLWKSIRIIMQSSARGVRSAHASQFCRIIGPHRRVLV